MKFKIRRMAYLLVVAILIVLVYQAFQPEPIEADAVLVRRGPLAVTIDEDGVTRAKNRYVVSAPVAGKLSRVTLREGDAIRAGAVVAMIEPVPIDPRQRLEFAARIDGALANQRTAVATLASARATLDQASRDARRAESLGEDGVIPRAEMERARTTEETAKRSVEAAQSGVRAAEAAVAEARAGLLAIDRSPTATARSTAVRSPVNGRVLRIPDASERTVQPGEALMEVGDLADIELVVDVLSADAVVVEPGARVAITDWGRPEPLAGTVRAVEPAAFTKVSALGVEEQRVNVIIDFAARPAGLGIGYRVRASIVTWESDDVLKAPISALFRKGDDWAVFVIDAGKVRLTPIQTGHRGRDEVELLGGLEPDVVIVDHPVNSLAAGDRITVRNK